MSSEVKHWTSISNLLQMSSEVKHLYMKVEFTGIVRLFFHFQRLTLSTSLTAMFTAICQKNILENVDSRFQIPCLEKVVVTVRSPLNAEQMSTSNSFKEDDNKDSSNEKQP